MPHVHSTSRTLLVAAAEIEARAILTGVGCSSVSAHECRWRAREVAPSVDMIVTGIGKTNAAAGTALSLERARFARVISIGIAGALPVPADEGTVGIGESVLATRSVYADEGLRTPDAFLTCRQMGFALGPFEGDGVVVDPRLRDLFAPLVARTGVIATVSTCSGTDELAAQTRDRTGAVAECMEGAAVGHVCASWSAERGDAGVAFAEVRVISNTTGDRATQRWDMKAALGALASLSGRVAAAVSTD